MMTAKRTSRNSKNALEAARHICQEARVVLTSLRGGPLNVARGELAQDLMELGILVKAVVANRDSVATAAAQQHEQRPEPPAPIPTAVTASENKPQQQQQTPEQEAAQLKQEQVQPPAAAQPQSSTSGLPKEGSKDAAVEAPSLEKVDRGRSMPPLPSTSAPNVPPPGGARLPTDEVGLFARPFLAVVMDPRAAGPHTLVALRALFRLLESGSLLQSPRVDTAGTRSSYKSHHDFLVALEPLTKGVLACKFEQTDAGADEAVEMAIADLLALLVKVDSSHSMHPETLMDAFNTVFVTRNTFVHSPALCYHFEDVLTSMVEVVFSQLDDDDPSRVASPRLVLEFLVNQLLHTPLIDNGDRTTAMDDSLREAQVAHDATRVLCLRLTRKALVTGWGQEIGASSGASASSLEAPSDIPHGEERSLLNIIQDDLCLSLLMMGQAIWAYHDASSNISPGFISPEVLAEICATLSTLWNTLSLRQYLIAQFETIFTGFYQRALVLLRKRFVPIDSMSFNANLVFDAEVEIILESLVDLLCLHDHQHSIAEGDGGALETLFAMYDCHMSRSDVAVGLMIELCRCCGGIVDEEGETITSTPAPTPLVNDSDREPVDAKNAPEGGTLDQPKLPPTPAGSERQGSVDTQATGISTGDAVMVPSVGEPWRPVPPHLKELCAEALMGAMKCLFCDDKASVETMRERSQRESIMESNPGDLEDAFESPAAGTSTAASISESTAATSLSVSHAGTSQASSESPSSRHNLRHIKSKKRLMRLAAQFFNKKSSKGIEYLVASGLVPDPITPASVASFLRNGIVVGLDKRAVGAYLGDVGKAPVAGKSPPLWERDWFHKEVLTTYCGLFRFEHQSLLDGLRMFLAAFRLPGEAQQIDRILQAFADSCGQKCEESCGGSLKLFSDDPKRASDAAYLLSFSIIMLNTDQHNDNIREDRKMTVNDFVKNNTDYGRDITEPGKELPAEFLQGIYESIREEEIRTEGEGADGCMTVERWKDVLRGSTDNDNVPSHQTTSPTEHDAEDLTELVLEHVWKPIISALGSLWNMNRIDPAVLEAGGDSPGMPITSPAPTSFPPPIPESPQSGMLGAQGARLGMDLALEMLVGVRNLGRIDIFQKIFLCVCHYTGLLGDYDSNVADRTWSFAHSIEGQSAVIVAIRTARDASTEIGADGWKRVWAMLFELRDLKMLGGGVKDRRKSILRECDPDLLSDEARRDWTMKLMKGGLPSDGFGNKRSGSTGAMSSVFGAMGRALFGSDNDISSPRDTSTGGDGRDANIPRVQTPHGKEDHVVWDELAPSDDEDEDVGTIGKTYSEDGGEISFMLQSAGHMSAGAMFENQLIHEDMLISQQQEMPVTGLERVDDTLRHHFSPRARVRKRLLRACDFSGLVSDSRFLDIDGICNLLAGLIKLIPADETTQLSSAPPSLNALGQSDVAAVTNPYAADAKQAIPNKFPVSPASQALAEVLLCEIVLKNRDRLGVLWKKLLKNHYTKRFHGIVVPALQMEATTDEPTAPNAQSKESSILDPVLEKRVTGLLRICACAVQRDGVANEVLGFLTTMLPSPLERQDAPRLWKLDKHIGEGLWRISRNVDGLHQLGPKGWGGLLALTVWSAKRGVALPPIRSSGIGRPVGLAEDDPALQAYRSIHLILNAAELPDDVPCKFVDSIRVLVVGGERRNCPKLSIAALDLLRCVLVSVEKNALSKREGGDDESDEALDKLWTHCWRPIVQGMAETAALSARSAVRQHSLSMLTDSFLDKPEGSIPVSHLCSVLGEVCVPIAGRRILDLRNGLGTNEDPSEESKIELELWIGLIFKPLRHHLSKLVQEEGTFLNLWKSVLSVLEELLGGGGEGPEQEGKKVDKSSQDLLRTMMELANEHLRNAILVLIDFGVLKSDTQSSPGDITSVTWESVGKMSFCTKFVAEWKQAAAQQ